MNVKTFELIMYIFVMEDVNLSTKVYKNHDVFM